MVGSGSEDGQRRSLDLLSLVVSVGLVAIIVFTPVGEWRPLAIVVGLPFVLLAPGYALVSAIFPRAGETAPGPTAETSWLGRVGLSVGGSVIAIALVGGLLDFTVWGFDRIAVAVGLSLFTLVATAVAWYRRRQVSSDSRAGVKVDAVGRRARALVAGTGVTGIVLMLVVLGAASGALVLVADKSTQSGSVTEFYILGQNESGDLVAGSYPTNLTIGEPATVGIGVGTSGSTSFEGTVVSRLERVGVENGRVRIDESRRLDSFAISAAAGETTIRRHTFQPPIAGERLRLTYRLFRGDATAPFRKVHVWVSVAPQT